MECALWASRYFPAEDFYASACSHDISCVRMRNFVNPDGQALKRQHPDMALSVLSGAGVMLFLVLLTDEPEFSDLRLALRERRQEFLDATAKSGRLLAEGSFVDGGNVMVIRANSTGDAIALLQADPYVVQPVSNRVQIRPLVWNFIAAGMLDGDGESKSEGAVR
jgi:uncharacterized protein YciI